MNKIETHQTLSLNKPREENQDIGIMIYCAECEKGRAFKINENLKRITERENAEFSISTTCEGCGRRIVILIGHINARKEGYSYRFFDKENTKEFERVIDKNGLSDLHE